MQSNTNKDFWKWAKILNFDAFVCFLFLNNKHVSWIYASLHSVLSQFCCICGVVSHFCLPELTLCLTLASRWSSDWNRKSAEDLLNSETQRKDVALWFAENYCHAKQPENPCRNVFFLTTQHRVDKNIHKYTK